MKATLPSYNQIAGQSVERLGALSDGIFAVAMTLLVLDLHTPANHTITSEHELGLALVKIAPQLTMFAMSFLTLGIFWTGQQTQLNHFARSNRHMVWIHLAFLFVVSVVPFSTHLLADFITYRLALLLYWLNILVLGLVLFTGWNYGIKAGLLKAELDQHLDRLVRRRIFISQSLYAFGALLCIFSTYCSIGFIVLVQLNYAIAPETFLRRRGKKQYEQVDNG